MIISINKCVSLPFRVIKDYSYSNYGYIPITGPLALQWHAQQVKRLIPCVSELTSINDRIPYHEQNLYWG